MPSHPQRTDLAQRPPEDEAGVARRLQAAIAAHPGLHFRALGRLAQVPSLGQLRHHLDRLQREGRVVELADGRFKRFFPAGAHAALRPGMARLRRPLPSNIVRLLLEAPLSRGELQAMLACPPSSLGYHLQRMVAAGDVQRLSDGASTHYVVADAALVRRTLDALWTPASFQSANPTGPTAVA